MLGVFLVYKTHQMFVIGRLPTALIVVGRIVTTLSGNRYLAVFRLYQPVFISYYAAQFF